MSVSEVLFGKMNLFFSLLAFFCHWDYSERKNSRVRVLLVLSPEMPLHIGAERERPIPRTQLIQESMWKSGGAMD